MHHYPRQLSGGQEQRVGDRARDRGRSRRSCSCDEPTGDLDRKSADEILELLDAAPRERGKTMLMVTHDPLAAERAGRSCGTWRRGALVDGMKYLHLRSCATCSARRSARRSRSARSRWRCSSSACWTCCTPRSARASTSRAPTGWSWSNASSIIQPLPLAYRDRLLRVPGVKESRSPTGSAACTRTSGTSSRSSPSTGRLYREDVPRVPGARRPVAGLPRRQGGRGRRRGAGGAVRLEGRRSRPASRARSSRGSWEFNVRGDLSRRAAAGRRQRSSGSAGTTSTSGAQFRKGMVGWYTVRIARSR